MSLYTRLVRPFFAALCIGLGTCAVAHAQTNVDAFNPGQTARYTASPCSPMARSSSSGYSTGSVAGALDHHPREDRPPEPRRFARYRLQSGRRKRVLSAVALQPDGKILVGGVFSWLGGGAFDEPGTAIRHNIGRLHADGSVDLSFDPGASLGVNAIAVQPDGKIVVAGCFHALGGGGSGTTPRHSIGRLNADGSLDTSFDAGTNGCLDAVVYSRMERSSSVGHSIPSVAVGQAQRHGTGLGGSTPTARSTRVSTQGWISTSMRLLCRRMERLSSAARFRPWSLAVQGRRVAESDGSTPTVHSIRASIRDRTAGSTRSWSQPDGKIVVGGSFTRLGGGGFPPQSRPEWLRIGRLHADGSLDTGFNPGAESQVYALAVQPDGKVLAGGGFLALGGGAVTPRFHIGRVDVGPPTPAAFNKVSPANAATSQPLLATLTWGSSAGAGGYEYCYDVTNNSSCDGTWLSISTTNVLIGPLNGGTIYYWQVRARNPVGTTDANGGSWWSFATSGSITPPTTVNDSYTSAANTPLAVPAPGVLTNDSSNGGGPLSATLVASVGSGVLTFNADGSFVYTPNAGFIGGDSFTYRAANAGGPGNIATVSIAVGGASVALPPTALLVSSLVGNQVTLRWNAPVGGLVPTGYVLEGGVNPGEVLASIPLGTTTPVHTFTAPNGAFYLRLHAVAGSSRSNASNEIRVFVNVPAPPSAPTNLLGMANGVSLGLAWRNTFAGGAPSSLVLDVTGSASASLPLGLSDAFSFNGIPPGTYTFALRATNAAGTSAPSNTVTLTFPTGCSGLPLSPTNFLASKVGNTISLMWDPAAAGPAPTGYVLNVGGSFVLSVPLAGRGLSATVGPGVYELSVTAVNACGLSPATAVQTVVIP